MNIRTILASLVAIGICIYSTGMSASPAHGYAIFIDASNNKHATGIPAWLQQWENPENSVTVVTDYKGENLSGYDIVMDFDNDAYHALTLQERTAYTAFLNRGGGLYLQGERTTDNYLLRDMSVLAYLDELGAGAIKYDPRDIFLNLGDPYVRAVPSPVTQNTSLKYHYDTSLIITDPGNGFFVATTNRIDYPLTNPHIILNGVFSMVIGFDKGQLLNAPNGRVIGFFDTTYLDSPDPDKPLDPVSNPDLFKENQPFFTEIVKFLGDSKSVSILSPIPEPSTALLVLCGGAALLALHRRKKRNN